MPKRWKDEAANAVCISYSTYNMSLTSWVNVQKQTGFIYSILVLSRNIVFIHVLSIILYICCRSMSVSVKFYSLRRSAGWLTSWLRWGNYSDLTRFPGPPNGGLVREFPLFQGNLGWWNIMIWPDICFRVFSQSDTKFGCHDFPMFFLCVIRGDTFRDLVGSLFRPKLEYVASLQRMQRRKGGFMAVAAGIWNWWICVTVDQNLPGGCGVAWIQAILDFRVEVGWLWNSGTPHVLV